MRDLQSDLIIAKGVETGPWTIYGKRDHDSVLEIIHGPFPDLRECFNLFEDISEKDAEFIVGARAGWQEAIERALDAEEKLERLKKEFGVS